MSKPKSLETENPERRRDPRYAVDGPATLYPVNHNSGMPCRIVELSEHGCRLSTDRPVFEGGGVRVELAFKVRGVAFRLGGTTQWLSEHHLLGVHFTAMSSRRKCDLDDVLAELEAEAAKEAAKNPSEGEPEAAETEFEVVAEQPQASEAEASAAVEETSEASAEHSLIQFPGPGDTGTSSPGGSSNAVPPSGRERRAQRRHNVDSHAIIFLLDIRAQVTGKIIDVSMGGCRIRTDERFPVGIYRRLELGFTLDGLPFRLAGVTQAVHDRFTIGIRFLDVSERKRDQLQMIIDEIDEMRHEGRV